MCVIFISSEKKPTNFITYVNYSQYKISIKKNKKSYVGCIEHRTLSVFTVSYINFEGVIAW